MMYWGILNGARIGIAICVVLQLASPSWARLAPFDGIGGNGGAPYRLDCGESAVLVGVTGQSGLVIDRLAGHCVKIDPVSGTWVGGVYETAPAGGTGGSRFHKACPVGQALVGLEGTIKYFSGTDVVASLGINCTALKIRQTINLRSLKGSGRSASMEIPTLSKSRRRKTSVIAPAPGTIGPKMIGLAWASLSKAGPDYSSIACIWSAGSCGECIHDADSRGR